MKMQIIGTTYASKERWEAMKAIYDSCEKLQITPPDDVIEFFDNNDPEDKFYEEDLEKVDLDSAVTVNGDGFTVDLQKIESYNNSTDPEIHFIHFKILDT